MSLRVGRLVGICGGRWWGGGGVLGGMREVGVGGGKGAWVGGVGRVGTSGGRGSWIGSRVGGRAGGWRVMIVALLV